MAHLTDFPLGVGSNEVADPTLVVNNLIRLQLLTVRAESARLRRGGVRLHRTAARKPAQDQAFSVLLCRILSENTGT